MSPLRILHVVPYYEHAWAYGGIPRLATAMTRTLAARGHTVTVCTTDACDSAARLPRGQVLPVNVSQDLTPAAWGQVLPLNVLPEARPDPGVRVRVFPNVSNRLAYDWQLFAPLGLASFLRAHVQEFDIAHLHACRNLPVVIAANALRRARVPYVVSPNGTAPAIERRLLAKRVFDVTLGRGMLTGADRVLAVSDAEARQLTTLGISEDRISVVPNPIDDSEFTQPRHPAAFRAAHGVGDAPLVLFLGKLTPRKGVDVLVHAFAQLRTSGARLLIAGNDMGPGSTIDALVTALGVDTRARRIGLLRGPARLDALAAADVVVYPSKAEVFGLVPLEALLCGTPAVVCNDSGCGEIVTRVGGGQVVPYGDPAALASAIDAILVARDIWRVRVGAAAARVRRWFASGPVCARVEGVYRDVLAARSDDRSMTGRRGA